MHSEQSPVLHYAVLASIALHGALLASVPRREPVRLEPPAPLVARLVEPPAPVLVPEVPREPAKVKRARPKPIARAAPAPQPAPLAVEPKVEAPVAETPAPPPVIARTEPVPAAPPVFTPAETKTLDASSIAHYRLQVISAAGKFKKYPRLAMENNWQGDVIVRVAFLGNGRLAGLTIQSSSGHGVLDQQALEMFKKAAAAVSVPPALHGQEFSFEVRAVYNLKDQASG